MGGGEGATEGNEEEKGIMKCRDSGRRDSTKNGGSTRFLPPPYSRAESPKRKHSPAKIESLAEAQSSKGVPKLERPVANVQSSGSFSPA